MMKLFYSTLKRFYRSKVGRYLFFYRYYRNVINVVERSLSYSSSDSKRLCADFRRLTHIVDKGLRRNDFEKGRSRQAYENAKKILEKITEIKGKEDNSIEWGKEVLREYSMRQLQKQIEVKPEIRSIKKCSYEELVNTIHSRRSIRRYKKQRISDEKMRKIVEVVNWSPSSCNRQTAFVFMTNSSELSAECLSCCSGKSGFSEYIPAFFTFCANVLPYDMPHEVTIPYIDVSLGVQNCNLVAHSLGISITLLSWAKHGAEEEARLRALLNIPDHFEIIINGVAGYPAQYVEAPSRKPLDKLMVIRR